MRVEWDMKLGFKDVMIRPKRSSLKSRSQVDLNRSYRFKHSKKVWTGVPIIAANMDGVGTFSMVKTLSNFSCLTALHKHYSVQEWQDFIDTAKKNNIIDSFMLSTGILERDYDKLGCLLGFHPEINFICIDVANGYTQVFVDYVKKIRDSFPDKTIIAGNVVTPEMSEELLLAGADIIKVGIGPGSVCTTRLQTGIGYPQVSAVMECADAAHGLKGHVISDGGCVCAGDVAKALAAGADFVMIGGMFAGYDESEKKVINRDGKTYREFYGMSSKLAMEKHTGKLAEYRASEGKVTFVEEKGSVSDKIQEICGGLRSTCTYVGAETLKELSKRTTFIRVCEQENRIFS